jgi:Trypsin-like peptidase domain
MIPIDIIHKVYNGTCAIGIVTVESEEELINTRKADAFHIFGTGFLCRYRTVITNRHVAEAMNAALAQHNLPDDRLHAQFNYFTGDRMEQCYSPIKKLCILKQPVEDDICLCEIVRLDEDPEDFKEAVQPLTVLENVKVLELGEEVGLVGFPYGKELHVDPYDPAPLMADKNLVRLGPILQHGFISGFRPWKRTYGIREIFVDARTIGGMSGSPVFRQQTGEVIGVHYAGYPAPVSHTVIARAVPLDSIRVAAFCEMLDRGKNEIVEGQIRYED